MNRPASRDFVLGHRATVAASSTIAVLASLSWLAHGVSWFTAGLTLLFCKACFAAKRRVLVWRQWRGAWDEIANPTPPASPSRTTPEGAVSKPLPVAPEPAARRSLRMPRSAFIAGWLVLVLVLRAHQGEASTPALGLGGLAFFALTLWGMFVALRNGARWLFAPSRADVSAKGMTAKNAPDSALDSDGNAIVTCCLPMPEATPSRHVRELLPDYCRALLAYAPGKASEQ